MPRYDVTLDTDTTIKGTLVNVPPVGGIENGSTVKNVYMTKEQAEFLDTNPDVTVKAVAEVKVSDLVAKIEKAKTFEELDELTLGDDRDSVATAVTNRRMALAEATQPEEPQEDLPAESSTATTAAPKEGGES